MENNDKPEYGKTYLLWRDGEFIGEATWTKDNNVGDSFIADEDIDGKMHKVVYIADSWVLKNEE